MLLIASARESLGGSTNSPPARSDQSRGQTFNVTRYVIDGNTALPTNKFDFLTNYTGRAVTVDRLREGLGKLRLLYRARGFATASVTLPPQRLTNGVIRVRVVEGDLARPTRTGSTNSPPPAPTLSILRYDIEGNTVLPTNKFDFLTNYAGPAVTFARLREGLGKLQLLYRDLGFATISITLPQQKLTNGVVRVRVIEGNLARITVTGNRYFSSNNVLRALPSLQTNLLPNTKWLQPEINRANLNPDRQIYPIVSPDEEPGYSDLTLKIKDRLPLHGHFEVNDKSTPGTPVLRLDTALEYNNLWQRENQIGLQYNASPQDTKPESFWPHFYDQPMIASYSGFYRMPLQFGESLREEYEGEPVDFGYDEVTHQFHLPQTSGNPEFIIYGSRSTSDTSVRYSPLQTVVATPLVQITSQSAEHDLSITENVGGKYTAPLREFAGIQSRFNFGFDYKSYHLQSFATNLHYFVTILTNNSAATTNNNTIALPSNSHEQVSYMPLSWSWAGERPDKFGLSAASVEQDIYLSRFESSRPNFQGAAGNVDAGGSFTKFSGNLSREELLGKGWSMLLRASGQWASEPLINNEQFPLGGTEGVRGYQEGDSYGDVGWKAQLDLRAPALGIGSFPVNGGRRIPGYGHPSVFMDLGQANILENSSAPTVRQWGTGLGFDVNATDHVYARFSLAWALRNTPVAVAGSIQAYFALGLQF